MPSKTGTTCLQLASIFSGPVLRSEGLGIVRAVTVGGHRICRTGKAVAGPYGRSFPSAFGPVGFEGGLPADRSAAVPGTTWRVGVGSARGEARGAAAREPLSAPALLGRPPAPPASGGRICQAGGQQRRRRGQRRVIGAAPPQTTLADTYAAPAAAHSVPDCAGSGGGQARRRALLPGPWRRCLG